jgi:hypothetical protein
MTVNRVSRETETREETARAQVWKPASALPEPVKRRGYEYRWVRVALLGQADPANLSAQLREGWEPVRIEEQPEFQMFVNPESRFKDNIEIGGLLLCKAPTQLIDQRREYYSKMAGSQMESVDNNFMRENDPRMPLFKERKSKTTFGSGS